MMIAVLTIGMTVGVQFLREVQKMLGETAKYASMLFVALMFAWDGIMLYMMTDYATKKELAIGIMLGTLIKCFLLIRYENNKESKESI